MTENRGARKRANSEASGEIKRRRITPATTAGRTPDADNLPSFHGELSSSDVRGLSFTKRDGLSGPHGLVLDNRYHYIRPGANANDEEGVDYLKGEAAVLQFIASSADDDVGVMSSGASGYGSGLCTRVATTDEYMCVWYVRCSLAGPVGAGTEQRGRRQGGRGRGSAHRDRERSQGSEVARELGGGLAALI
ncbi:hypothetical protein Pcac1_g5562 [Phytophthora cactorum]|uniref:Uncharacterized protein n=1 Tax=Phytophthora cactorum TaxID=29920 RepID=A0A329RCP4_9STRA|nr:hypothetical protein Pcac1_g5562 [Phytophthora cactorum]RAW22210.1 hypothetical protein PC110_g21348 [Phytophthora cactorum]